MRLGKVKASVMDRSIRRQLHSVMADQVRTDGFTTHLPTFVQTIHTVEGSLFAARRAVWGACGKMIASEGIPETLSFSILLSEETEEKALKKLTGDIREECSQWGVAVETCQAAVSACVRDMVVTASCLGKRNFGPAVAVDTGKMVPGPAVAADTGEMKTAPGPALTSETGKMEMTPGDPTETRVDLLVVGPIGLEGTAMIASRERESLLTRYPAFFIDEAACLYDPQVYKLVEEFLAGKSDIGEFGRPIQCHYLGEGGIFAGLWEYAASAGVGLEIALSRIPIRQHTIEVCEFFNLNPYQLLSGGSLLIACPNGGRLAEAFRERGLDARVIGHTTEGNARIIRYDEEMRYLEPPKMDEYYRIKT